MKAIIWREIKVTFNSVFGAIMQFAIPVFMILLFATSLSGNFGKMTVPGMEINYIEFFAPGLFGYMTFFLFTISFSFLSIDSRTGMLTIIALSKASLRSYFWGKYVFQLALTFIKILLIMLITMLLVGSIPDFSFANAILFIITLLLSVAIWFSLGMLGGIYIQREDLRQVVFALVTLPLTFTSSMYYGIERMPTIIRWIAMCNPLTYICNLFRGCYLNVLPADYLLQLSILFVITAVSLTAALWSLRKVKF